jgi:hypothetical protein
MSEKTKPGDLPGFFMGWSALPSTRFEFPLVFEKAR